MSVDNTAVARIIELMPETPASRFRINALAKERLAKIKEFNGKKDAQILEDAIAHLLSSLERDESVHQVVPSEQRSGRRPPRDAA